MALADPQSVTINAVAQSMPRIVTGDRKSTYQKNDGVWTFEISHTPNKDRIRSMVKLTQRAVVPDPLTAVNDYETLITYLVVDRPLAGFSMVQLEQQVAGFVAWLSNANVDKIYGQES